MFGGGSDHDVLFWCLEACCIALNSVMAAFQLRHLSNVVSRVEQVMTSGDILSFCVYK